MSVEFCHEHDRAWDSDFHEHCPACQAALLTRRQVAEAFEHLCCDRPQGCEGVFGVDGHCHLASALEALFGPEKPSACEAATPASVGPGNTSSPDTTANADAVEGGEA